MLRNIIEKMTENVNEILKDSRVIKISKLNKELAKMLNKDEIKLLFYRNRR